MPKGPKGQKRPADVIGNDVRVMEIATGQRDDAAAASLPTRLMRSGTALADQRCPNMDMPVSSQQCDFLRGDGLGNVIRFCAKFAVVADRWIAEGRSIPGMARQERASLPGRAKRELFLSMGWPGAFWPPRDPPHRPLPRPLFA
jgi:hypothetical protein